MRETKTEKQLKEFSQRLNQLLDEEGLSKKFDGRQTELASHIGMSQRGVRKWLEAEGMPDTKRLEKLCTVFNCSLEWLLTGRGEMRPTVDRATQSAAIVSKNAAKLIRQITKTDATTNIPNWALEIISTTLKQIEKSGS